MLADKLLEHDNVYVKDVFVKFNDGQVDWRLAVHTAGDNERLCCLMRSGCIY
ncbi:MAG TPA: hypothetical protein VF788_16165 [Pseudonocardiaceae bacterium]